MSFIKLCLSGDVLAEEIDKCVEDWHEGRAGGDQELHDFLGMNWDEYAIWATNPSILPFILAAHYKGISLDEEINRERYALAARARSAIEAKQIEKWLRVMGKI
ncbi:hypothetical protein [Pseudomonas sp. UBA2684]|uniref:hypothetical protein n=1 Tax=Pseudomonas sp. UBA2684 TaxID=1947311 RepID=UPI000E809D3A|nr:hypothetical protein [Pseudomonas sp. UBA2684]HBX56323.1 hypothetical protein [Pseudomonas sp.]|tara:strand:- start:1023 stop:1334 length:312 start_codon:yes stop_codon:yes gene_type:complete